MTDLELTKAIANDHSDLAQECRRLIAEKCQWEKACKELDRELQMLQKRLQRCDSALDGALKALSVSAEEGRGI